MLYVLPCRWESVGIPRLFAVMQGKEALQGSGVISLMARRKWKVYSEVCLGRHRRS